MRILIMTNERKEQLLDQILELMTAVAYDREPNEVAVPETTKAPAPEKVKMLTVKECTELIDGLSEHTVRMLVAQNKIKYIRTGESVRGKILVNKPIDAVKKLNDDYALHIEIGKAPTAEKVSEYQKRV